MRRDARADANQKRIVEALRAAGAAVEHLHMVGGGCADILVTFRRVHYLVEIKTEHGQLTDQQRFWHLRHAPVHVVCTPDEALRVLGLTP